MGSDVVETEVLHLRSLLALRIWDRTDLIPDGYCQNLKAPWVYSKIVSTSELERFLAQRGNSYPPYATETSPAVTNANARSLKLLIGVVRSSGARVCLVNMPLHPVLNRIISETRSRALLDFLNQLAGDGVTVIDWQRALKSEDFADLVDVNRAGRDRFTAQISQQLSTILGQRAVSSQSQFTRVTNAL